MNQVLDFSVSGSPVSGALSLSFSTLPQTQVCFYRASFSLKRKGPSPRLWEPPSGFLHTILLGVVFRRKLEVAVEHHG